MPRENKIEAEEHTQTTGTLPPGMDWHAAYLNASDCAVQMETEFIRDILANVKSDAPT